MYLRANQRAKPNHSTTVCRVIIHIYHNRMVTKSESLKIIHYPDPRLRETAKPIDEVNDEVRSIALRMIELMHEAEGVGLAAPQVGLDLRIFVANAMRENSTDQVFINPVLSEPSRETAPYDEGCLSIPGVRAQIVRPIGITITALDLEGRTFTLAADDIQARIWQHETDHLDGRLIIDRMSPIDRLATRRQIKSLEREFSPTRSG